MDRDLPEGVIDADPPGGWDETGDDEARRQSADAADSPDLVTPDPDAVRRAAPDDPVAGEQVRQGADPDLSADRGEEP